MWVGWHHTGSLGMCEDSAIWAERCAQPISRPSMDEAPGSGGVFGAFPSIGLVGLRVVVGSRRTSFQASPAGETNGLWCKGG